ncbi:hypothetical protein [Bosea sp. NBC_00550]|uniref:hypothetical protein n=1 Tax=Bosea sp. NBC_00550 TaxID=2969621 RepID=UPI0022319DA9|nr:hypothetical protein [Bosea sp. NBC_00550]UZF91647.1 hypothetical protein NWE53_21440 [Bosea sp. NBC_00550]
MHLKQMNPATPARAHSSAACNPEHSTPALIINRLQRRFAISELHAATVAHLAGLGSQAVR